MLGACGGVSSKLDLLNHLTPLYALAALVLLGAALALRGRWRWGAVALAVAGLAATLPTVIGGAAGDDHDPARPGVRVAVLTQNMWRDRPDHDPAIAGVLRADADVVAMQELEGPEPLAALRALEARYPYAADGPATNRYSTLAILSRYPITAWTYHVASWRGRPADRLSWIVATIQPPGGQAFDLYDLQLLHPWSGRVQLRQIEQLTALMAHPGRPTLVMGDFNTTPWSARMRAIQRAVGLPRRDGTLPTWPARLDSAPGQPVWRLPFLPLDHVFASRTLRVERIVRAPNAGSDHLGLIATVQSPR